ncbi:MAG: DUF2806 domain-containing protein [Candidatus Poribacteria bacterium]|nr:DUF2806 domain-containing protein [Candidatus Poribacteria bacterium]
MSDNPLVNLEGLTKPVSDLGIALIDKIGDATGILYEPTRIKRRAKAEAKAAKIQAEAKIEITDLQQRTLRRWIEEEVQRQESIEDIITKSFNKLNDDADPNAIEDDWIIKFFDKGRLITDNKVQDLWASILAGEANSAGSYSPKTLTTLADMNQKSLSLFNTFCSLCVVSLMDPHAFLKSPSNFKIGDARVPIIRGVMIDTATVRGPGKSLEQFSQKSQSMYQQYGFGINEFQLLLEHGLIQDETYNYYPHFWYDNELYIPLNPSAITPPKEEDVQQITISGFRLSSVGRELFHIAKRENPPEYLESLIDFLQEYYDVKIYRIPKSQESS